MHRLMTLIAATTVVAGFCVPVAFAQNAGANLAPPANLHPPVNLDSDTLRTQFTRSQLGLKPQSGSKVSGIELPLGLTYNRDAKGLLMPLDEKNEWGVGVGLNVNSTGGVDPAISNPLGLVQKRAPGLMLHRKF